MLDDRERHRQSVLDWMRRNGYHSLRSLETDARRFVKSAHLTEGDLMTEPSVFKTRDHTLKLDWLDPGEEPPRARNHRPNSVYDDLVDTLRQHPGLWARVEAGGKGCASMLRKRPGLEVKERQNGAGVIVYVRFAAADE